MPIEQRRLAEYDMENRILLCVQPDVLFLSICPINQIGIADTQNL